MTIVKVFALAILLGMCALPAMATSETERSVFESEPDAVGAVEQQASRGRALLAANIVANGMTTEDGTWDVRRPKHRPHPSGDNDDDGKGKKGGKKRGDDDDDDDNGKGGKKGRGDDDDDDGGKKGRGKKGGNKKPTPAPTLEPTAAPAEVCVSPSPLPDGSTQVTGAGFRLRDFSNRQGNSQVFLGEGNFDPNDPNSDRVDAQRGPPSSGWVVPDLLVTTSFSFSFDGMQSTELDWNRVFDAGQNTPDSSLVYDPAMDFQISTPPETWDGFRINVSNRAAGSDNLASSTIALRNVVLMTNEGTFNLGDFTTPARAQRDFFITQVEDLASGFTISGEVELFLASGEQFGREERSRVQISAIDVDLSDETCDGAIVPPMA